MASMKLTNPNNQIALGLLANSIVQLYRDRIKRICFYQANGICPYDGQYFHFASGRNYIVSVLSYAVPEWRNGRRRGFKIPRW